MKIYNGKDLDKLYLKNTAVALGEFDAIHKGHIDIIEKTVSFAKKKGFLAVVVMFENNPLSFISKKNVRQVNTLKDRFEILNRLKVDAVVALKFDEKIMNMPHRYFFENLLIKKLDAKFLSVGFNYKFGKDVKGDVGYLKAACEDKGIDLCVTEEIKLLGGTVSSTRIRKLIEDGRVDEGAELLGRHFSIRGVIIRGNGLGGSLLGFPTANIEIPDNLIVPKYGVYISKVKLYDKTYMGITNVGSKPTVSKKDMGIETHILNGKFGPLYGEKIKIYFCKYLRGIIAFNEPDELIKQLEKDKRSAIEYFKGV